ncbi:SH3 domain-containing protein [Leeuwenhoekiella polynyae]|uniref:Tetratricopeptide repeat protein n=1 Tax=Leeuwenhoekiella polynyae TaxID=1550906 RepID=A0A4Q0P8H5_9FLAO|nr:SH3 domain-containing protein [Leeuwenhoekiella polynyae]RXG22967.1 tetratricopeptide repeat protein [Leeuwenhoekiella polynyae]
MKIQGLMSRYSSILVALVVVLCVFSASAQTAQQLFETGNSQYAQNNYEEAIKNYEQVLDAGYESAEVYYNLANANYKLNRIAPSVYNYEKALALKPNDKEIKNNLQFAQNMTVDGITPLPENTFKKWWNQLLNLFTLDGWALVTVVLIVLFTLSFLVYYFGSKTVLKRSFFTIAFVSLGLGLLSLTLAFQARSNEKNKRFAVVFSPEAEIKNAPNMGSEEVFVLHEGTKVRVIEEQGDWQLIRLADGQEGWIPKTYIKLL